MDHLGSAAMHPSPRFIKKVPNSASTPAFKLTISHSFVQLHLLHLVDNAFELTSSAHSKQVWQARLAARRNKDRSEFILQGWKLFAEAHKIQAGDHILFELCSPYRMVARLVHVPPSEVAFPTAHSAPELPADMHASKALRTGANSSPTKQIVEGSSQAWSNGITSTSWPPLVPHSHTAVATPQASDPLLHPGGPKMADRVQSWLSFSSPSESGAAPSDTLVRMDHSSCKASQDASKDACKAEDTFGASSSPQHELDELQCIFDDLESLDPSIPDLPLGQVNAVQYQPPMFTKGLNVSSGAAELKPSHIMVPNNHMLGEEPQHHRGSKAMLKGYHKRLDKSSRSALKATVGLENSLAALCTIDDPGQRREAEAATSSYLSKLKESLWQTLVLANDMCD